MTFTLGVDPSAKKIALVGYDDLLRTVHVEAFVLYKGRDTQTPEAIYRAMEAMQVYCEELGPQMGERVAYVEEPLVGRGGIKTTVKQAYVGGVVRACLVEAGFAVVGIHPSTWRSRLGVKARTSDLIKAETARLVKLRDPKVWQQVEGDHDLVDGAALRLCAQDSLVSTRSA